MLCMLYVLCVVLAVLSLVVQDRWYRFRTYNQCFIGSEAITWLVDYCYANGIFWAGPAFGAAFTAAAPFQPQNPQNSQNHRNVQPNVSESALDNEKVAARERGIGEEKRRENSVHETTLLTAQNQADINIPVDPLAPQWDNPNNPNDHENTDNHDNPENPEHGHLETNARSRLEKKTETKQTKFQTESQIESDTAQTVQSHGQAGSYFLCAVDADDCVPVTRALAVQFLRYLVSVDLVQHVLGRHTMEDDYLFYRSLSPVVRVILGLLGILGLSVLSGHTTEDDYLLYWGVY